MPFLSANNMLIDLPYRSRLFGPRSSFRALINHSKSSHCIEKELERVGNYSSVSSELHTVPSFSKKTLRVKILLQDEVVVIQVDEKISNDDVLVDLAAALEQSSEEIFRKCVRLELASRTPERMLVRNIARMLMEKRKLTLVSIRCKKDALRKFASREHRLCFGISDEAPQKESLSVASAAEKPTSSVATTEAKKDLKIIHRTLRSGTVLRVANDVIIYGDVNAGAVVEAGGNVTVFGALRGAVHAGISKQKSCVMAVTLQPTQLQIGRQRAAIQTLQNIPRRWSPAIAHVAQNEIVVEDFRRSAVRPDMEL